MRDEPRRQMRQRVNRRRVRPVKILDDDHRRIAPLDASSRNVVNSRIKRSGLPLPTRFGGVNSMSRCRSDVLGPGRRRPAQRLDERRHAGRHQFVERLEHRKVRLGAGEPFGAATASNGAS